MKRPETPDSQVGTRDDLYPEVCLRMQARRIGGLDTLVFTAGIGENAPRVRRLVSETAGWLGVSIDPARNEGGETSIGAAASGVDVLVIPAEEERAVAEGALACLEMVETAPRRRNA